MKKRWMLAIILFLLVLTFGPARVQAASPIGENYNVSVLSYFGVDNELSTTVSNVLYGSKVQVEPPTDEAHATFSFAFWIVNGVVRKDLAVDYNFTVNESLSLTAIFKETGTYAVVFLDTNGQIIDHVQYLANTGLESATDIVDLPTKPGYTVAADKWGVGASLDNISEDTVFELHYTLSSESTYTLSVTNGTGSDTYAFNTIVTAVADEPTEGQYFSHWEENGVVVSKQSSYKFTILTNRSITAVYDTSPASDVPFVSLSNDLSLRAGYRSYLGQYYLPDGYELIEFGVITSTNSATITHDSASTTAVRSESSNATTNEFLKSIPKNHYAARGYLTVKETATGTISTVYSENNPTFTTAKSTETLTFEGVSKSSYTTADISLNGNLWTLDNTLIGTTVNSDRFADSQSARLSTSGKIQSTFAYETGINSIHLLYGLYGSDVATTFTVQYAYEWNPNDWFTVQSEGSDLSVSVTDRDLSPIDIALDINSSIYIRFVNSSDGSRINLDEIIINSFEYSDIVAPYLNDLSDASMFVGSTFDPLANMVSIDKFDGTLTSSISYEVRNSLDVLVESPGDFSALPVDIYTITYSVIDSSLNETQTERALTINEVSLETPFLSENFESLTTWSSYPTTETTKTFGGFDWNIVQVLLNADANDKYSATSEQGLQMLRFRGSYTAYIYSVNAFSEVSKITFDAKYYSSTNSTAVMKVQTSSNGGSTWTDISTVTLGLEYASYSIDINQTNVQIRIIVTVKSANLDNLKVFGTS